MTQVGQPSAALPGAPTLPLIQELLESPWQAAEEAAGLRASLTVYAGAVPAFSWQQVDTLGKTAPLGPPW